MTNTDTDTEADSIALLRAVLLAKRWDHGRILTVSCYSPRRAA